jgi:hypothetical protein
MSPRSACAALALFLACFVTRIAAACTGLPTGCVCDGSGVLTSCHSYTGSTNMCVTAAAKGRSRRAAPARARLTRAVPRRILYNKHITGISANAFAGLSVTSLCVC